MVSSFVSAPAFWFVLEKEGEADRRRERCLKAEGAGRNRRAFTCKLPPSVSRCLLCVMPFAFHLPLQYFIN